MMLKKMLYALILLGALSPLLVNQAFAHQITVFAPINYNIPPVLPFPLWGNANSPGASSYINPLDGWTSLNIPAGAGPGWAESWFDTGWKLFNSTIAQSGSVTADAWINYTITGTAGIRAFLFVYEYNPTGTLFPPFQWWVEVASNAVPGNWESSFDLNVNPNDKSNVGNPFSWTPGSWYMARVLLFANAANSASSFVTVAPLLIPPLTTPPFNVGKFDDILFITYVSSTDNDFVNPQPLPPSILPVPAVGPVGTPVDVNGTGFQPNEDLTLYWDSTPVGTTMTDANGSFFDVFFDVPTNSTNGPHVISATGANDSATSFFDVFVDVPPLVGDLNGDGTVNILDAILLSNSFGQTDPNILDPPAATTPATTAAATKFTYTSMIAMTALIPLAFFGFRRKKTKKVFSP